MYQIARNASKNKPLLMKNKSVRMAEIMCKKFINISKMEKIVNLHINFMTMNHQVRCWKNIHLKRKKDKIGDIEKLWIKLTQYKMYYIMEVNYNNLSF